MNTLNQGVVNTNQRFVHEEDKVDDGRHNRLVIDKLNPAIGPLGGRWDCKTDDEIGLRGVYFYGRLYNLVYDLLFTGGEEDLGSVVVGVSRPFNEYAEELSDAICASLLASCLHKVDISVSIQKRFDGTLKRERRGMLMFTSISYFCDDVERLLRDLFGDIDGEQMDSVLGSVLVITRSFICCTRKDLSQEDINAQQVDWGLYAIDVPDGYDYWGMAWKAQADLAVRVRGVLENPSAFSKYTVEFANRFSEHFSGEYEWRGEAEVVGEAGHSV